MSKVKNNFSFAYSLDNDIKSLLINIAFFSLLLIFFNSS
jgi:hypothetical protein